MEPEQDEKIATCCDCGYQWKRGQDGSHSCSKHFITKIARLEAEIIKLQAHRQSACYELDQLTRSNQVLREALERIAAFGVEQKVLSVSLMFEIANRALSELAKTKDAPNGL